MDPIPVKFGEWFEKGFALYKQNIVPLILASLIALVLGTATLGILAGPMLAGLFLMVLAFHDGREPRPDKDHLVEHHVQRHLGEHRGVPVASANYHDRRQAVLQGATAGAQKAVAGAFQKRLETTVGAEGMHDRHVNDGVGADHPINDLANTIVNAAVMLSASIVGIAISNGMILQPNHIHGRVLGYVVPDQRHHIAAHAIASA